MSFFKKLLTERNKVVHKTDIMAYDRATGELIDRRHNKIIISGSAFTASKHFNIEPAVKLGNYNTALDLDGTVSSAAQNPKCICLYSVGIDGVGTESSQIIEPDYKKWCAPAKLVPFRELDEDTELDEEEKQIYFGLKTESNGRKKYYFKAFQTEPVMYMQYTNGTPVEATLFNGSNNPSEAECFMEINLSITEKDCREFFANKVALDEARINTISLLAAWYTEDDYGVKTFQDITPITKLNITEENLSDRTKGIDYVYHIYY